MAIQYYYSAPAGRLLHPVEVQRSTGITPDLSSVGNIAQLNRAQVFPLTDTPDPYNPSLYTTVVSYVTANYSNGATLYDGTQGPVGDYATQSYTPTARPLATAKTNGKQDVRTRASDNSAALRESSGYSADALSAAAAQLEADRGADVQATIALTESVMDQADSNIQAVDAATSVSDIADIVDAPDLVINTGRGIGGDSLDINPTYFPTINLGNVVEADLELYLPATDRTLGYRTNLPAPYRFDSNSAAFTGGDARIVVRIAATGVVLGTVVCPDTGAGANVDVDVYTAQS
jgi:hypothetical protein